MRLAVASLLGRFRGKHGSDLRSHTTNSRRLVCASRLRFEAGDLCASGGGLAVQLLRVSRVTLSPGVQSSGGDALLLGAIDSLRFGNVGVGV